MQCRFFGCQIDRIDRDVERPRNALEPDERHALRHRSAKRDVVSLPCIGAAPLVAKEAVGSFFIGVRALAWTRRKDRAHRERGVELPRLPDPLLGCHEANWGALEAKGGE